MPKRLFLSRHAKSSWDDPTLRDFERPLNTRGKRDAPMMAQKLKAYGIKPDLIVSSDAKRAADTAHIYAETLQVPLRYDSRIYEASAQSLLYLIDTLFEHYDNVMIVGHNPTLTDLANILGDKPIANLQTAATVGIDLGDTLHKRGHTSLYLYPKLFK